MADVVITSLVYRKKIELGNLRSLIILLLPVLFLAISLSYSSEGYKAGDKFLPLLMFPVIFSIIATKEIEDKVLNAFLFSILSMCVVSMIHALYSFVFVPIEEQRIMGDFINSVQTEWNALTYENLMLPFKISPIYMSMYVSFAFYILLFRSTERTVVKAVGLGFLIIFQLLTASRIGLFAFLITLAVLFVLHPSRKIKLYFLIGMIFVFIGSALLTLFNPVLKKRFISDVVAFTPPDKMEGWNSLNLRIAIWDCSLAKIRESPIAGYGLGDQYNIRRDCYREKYTFYGPYGTELNSHNQYLEFLIIGGGILLVSFLLQLIFSFKSAIDSGLKIQLIFLVLFAVICCGESLLETHKGIVFYSLFNSLFIFSRSDKANV